MTSACEKLENISEGVIIIISILTVLILVFIGYSFKKLRALEAPRMIQVICVVMAISDVFCFLWVLTNYQLLL
jgi:protein-S-isoprenylcysteine O-methyltransferase Ste14